MYNLHVHIEKIEILHIITYKWKHSNIVSSGNSFMSEIEGMKNCMNRVKTENAGMGLWWFWHHLFVELLEETVLFTTQRVCKLHYLTRVCNHYPKLTLHITGLCIYNDKLVIVKTWNKVRETKHSADT